MLVYQISLTIAEIIIICGVIFACQLYIKDTRMHYIQEYYIDMCL